MVDILYNIDVSIFYFINHTLSFTALDKFFVYLTDVKHWYLVYIIFWLMLVIKGGRIGRIAAFGALLLITFSDQLNSTFLKSFFERARPCNVLDDVNILVVCTGSYSFPSSHAVNNFAVAAFFSMLYPNYKKALFITAFLVALSRPYVGVHYPSDIIIGALIGYGIGYLFALGAVRLDKYIEKKFVKNKEELN
ncbi:MAG: phosphatase PAP2 family protein [Melioribacteraceae bacterium]|nr:phosphatase PAP2 family protein [Melioribacteraceae bacterium]MCF8354018.1 phosphatase PAP2 family protein [Melioribacteraceae bacterium]MCF8392301.1 phosphatase PAP2 family protein [Melioribacteraceae bacterium]MCF8417633.1 phosphatase PAP2 family protein [Melioribacteraceae bacterium]